MIDIKPVLIGNLTCFEELIVLMLKWNKVPYEYYFIDLLGFDFINIQDSKINSISDRIIEGNEFCSQNIYNIAVRRIKKRNLKDDLAIIKNELLNNRPVLLEMDSYWLPWREEYKKLHYFETGHTCMAVGINDNSLFCIDTMPVAENGIVSIDDFSNGYIEYIVFNFDNLRKQNYDNLKIFNNIKKIIYKSNYFTNSFDALLYFSKNIQEAFDPIIEFSKYKDANVDVYFFPIIYKIRHISSGYKLMLYLLDYLGKQLEMNFRSMFDVDIIQIHSLWDQVHNLLVKLFYTNSYDKNILTNISLNISDISKYTESLYEKLIVKVIPKIFEH